MLTDKGSDFWGVLAAMTTWGDRWLADATGLPITLHHNECGHDIRRFVDRLTSQVYLRDSVVMEWTGARYVDAPTVEASTWINGTAEQVWQVVSDVELMPTLSGELQSATWCDGCTGPGVGHKFIGHNKHDAMGEWSTTSYIVECEPPRVFAWAVQDSANPTSSWRFTLEPAAGGTTLRQWMQMGPAPSGLSIAIERMPELEQKIVFVRLRELESSITNTLAAIKQRIESCAPRPQ